MIEPNFESEKLMTLIKGTQVKVLKVFDNGWSYIYSSYIKGYVLSEGLSNINPINIEQKWSRTFKTGIDFKII